MCNYEETGLLTSSGLRQTCQTKQGVVARDGLKSDVRVPLAPLALLVAAVQKAVKVQLLELHGRDDADLVVAVQPAAGVANGVDVQLRGFRLP